MNPAEARLTVTFAVPGRSPENAKSIVVYLSVDGNVTVASFFDTSASSLPTSNEGSKSTAAVTFEKYHPPFFVVTSIALPT